MNREKLAWAAGFYDGEGCTSLSRIKGSIHIRLSIPQMAEEDGLGGVYSEVLEKFHGIFRVGNITGPYRNTPTGNEYMRYYVSGFEAVQYIISSLWPFLSTTKKEQYIRCLNEVTYIKGRKTRKLVRT